MNRNFVEDLILEMADIVIENRNLREENYYLKDKLNKNNDNFDELYKNSTNQVANILNKFIEKAQL